MKYTPDEAFEEIKRRGRKIRLDHEKKMTKTMWAVSSVLAIVLIGTMGMYVKNSVALTGTTAYGSFLLPAESGGYVLIAVIAFLAGVFLTLILRNYTEKKKPGLKNLESGSHEQ